MESREYEEEFLIKNEPHKFTEEHFNLILKHLDDIGGSDVYLLSGEPIFMDVQGLKKVVSRNSLSFDSLEVMLKSLKGSNAIGRLNGGIPINDEYETKMEVNGELKRFRYRMNFTGVKNQGKDGIQATIRSIPVTPPPLEAIGLSADHPIFKSFFPLQGLVLVTGPTGSGKSTLMASCVAAILGIKDANRVINTYEAPIEFVFDEIFKYSCLISQSTIPDNCASFKKGIENSLRRKPEIIIIGELRDRETIEAAIEAAQTGHLVIATTHTNGVPETIRRLINTFPSSDRESIQSDIIECLQLIVSQRLLKTVDKKRIAVREYLKFTMQVKERLLNVSPLKINLETREILKEKGLGIVIDATKSFEAGILLESDYIALCDTFAFE